MPEPTDARDEHRLLSDSDALRLSRGIRRQDASAITEFYERWFDWCLAAARTLTKKDEAFALDVVQDTMLRVIRSMPEIDSANAQRRWLSRVICNAAIDRIRRDDRRTVRERAVSTRQSHEAKPLDPAAHAETLAWLRSQLDELDAQEAVLLRTRFAEGQPLRVAATATSTTEDAAHGRVRRVLRALRLRGKDHEP